MFPVEIHPIALDSIAISMDGLYQATIRATISIDDLRRAMGMPTRRMAALKRQAKLKGRSGWKYIRIPKEKKL